MHWQFSLNLVFLHLFAVLSTTLSSTILRADPATTYKKKQVPYKIIIGTTTGVLLLAVLAIFLALHKSRKQQQYMAAHSVRETGIYLHDHHTNCSLTKK